jgi:hypothetical protein
MYIHKFIYVFFLITSWLALLCELNGYCLSDKLYLVLSLFVCVFLYFVSLFTRAYFIIGLWAAE